MPAHASKAVRLPSLALFIFIIEELISLRTLGMPDAIESTSVLIVGAGPVGMATAALLKKQGISVEVIEQNSEPTPYSKAIGVHARTLESMNALGLSESLVSAGNPISAFRLIDGQQSILSSSFARIDSGYPFVLGLPQSRMERLLLGALEDAGGRVRWNTKMTGLVSEGRRGSGGQRARVAVCHPGGREGSIDANWVIAADGSRSSVRDMANIAFPGGDYQRSFILGDVKVDWKGPRDELRFYLSPRGYLLIIPMPDGLYRIIAQTDFTYDAFRNRGRVETQLEDLQEIVDRNGPGDIKVHSPQWLTEAPFYYRTASTFLQNRVILAGDAAHLFSPLGAQGLNTGLQDAFNLGWKLGLIERGLADERLIESYEVERRPIIELVAGITARTTRYITATALPQRLWRRHLTRLANPRASVQIKLPELLAGLKQRYPDNGPVSAQCRRDVIETGTRVPHAMLACGDMYVPLARYIHGMKFVMLFLVRFGTSEALNTIADHWRSLKWCPSEMVLPIIITREIDADVDDIGVTVLEDRLGSLINGRIKFGEFACIAVRPDGFCFGSIHGQECTPLLEALRTVVEGSLLGNSIAEQCDDER